MSIDLGQVGPVITFATGPSYPQTGDTQLTTPGYVAAAIAAIPADATTPLAGIAALTALNRGLSIGEVDIPTNRALTVAEMTQANAAKVSIPLAYMQAMFTNNAVEAAAPGVMNTDGGLGYKARMFAATPETFAAAIAQALDNNGAHVRVNFTGGETIAMPPPRYEGQVVTLRFTAPSGAEIILDTAATGYAGMVRDSQHKFRPASTTDNRKYIYRATEHVTLFGMGSGASWVVAPFQPRMLTGNNWLETHDGRVQIHSTVTFSLNTPANQTQALDFTLPLSISSYIGATVHLTDVTGGVVAVGLSASVAGNASTIFAEHQPNRTATSLRLLARNMLATTASPGVVMLSILNATPNYAALGGIASF